ncbi:DUF6503 family protein [Algibacter mikhailovii]|uniref:Threonine synthase n=1 Tax=Algibacter mikhailovii TaxID=425498 RepID=A0A918QZX4_9FLAO|nr:DUF6503 family protein [Algibacter mikhailovii]GGZ77959.1 hypothetical protein GCM10007028_14200 [Algibacter mikhailovii]
MKSILFVFSVFLFVACKEQKEKVVISSKEDTSIRDNKYPKNLLNVFEAHGGLKHWNTFQTLEFTMEKPNGAERTLTDLKNRKSFISTDKFQIGYNGQDVWIKQDSMHYKGKPKFYYNLMLYFYAMPFILADDGIVYSDADPLVFEGQTFPGIRIGYNSGVGESPEDEYILYFDAETHKMTWLGYTVTFFTKEKGKEFHFIKYSDWQEVNGLILPETLSWYAYENNKPTEKKSDLKFINIKVSKDKINSEIFEVPEGAQIVE